MSFSLLSDVFICCSLQAYALIAKGVRLVCTNTTGRDVKSVVLKTQGSGCLKDNIITVFGMSTFTCLVPVSMCMENGCALDGFLSKPGYGSGRNLGDRQFFFVNGRPVEMPKISKLLNELYRSANSRQYPIAIMNFTIPTGAYDVNVTPDKRKIFFSDEGTILRSFRESVEKIYSPNDASYSVHKVEEQRKGEIISKVHVREEESRQPTYGQPEECSNQKGETCDTGLFANSDTVALTTRKQDIKDFSMFLMTPDSELKDLDSTTKNQRLSLSPEILSKASNYNSSHRPNVVQSSLEKYVTLNKRKHDSSCLTLSEVPLLRNGPTRCQSREYKVLKQCTLSESPIISVNIDDSLEVIDKGPQLSNASPDASVSVGTEIPFCYGGNMLKGKSEEVCMCSSSQHVSVFCFLLERYHAVWDQIRFFLSFLYIRLRNFLIFLLQRLVLDDEFFFSCASPFKSIPWLWRRSYQFKQATSQKISLKNKVTLLPHCSHLLPVLILLQLPV